MNHGRANWRAQSFESEKEKTMEAIRIIDDGTLDTVVLFMGMEHRYDSEFRFSFDSDDEFLEFAELQLSAEFLRHRKLRQDMDAMFAAANKELSL